MSGRQRMAASGRQEARGRALFGEGAAGPERLPRLRCALYTRKSSEEGLDQAFNSLDAQRDACEAYVASQRHEGWIALPTAYDDGGWSGGTLDRPALRRLVADIEAGLVDMVVCYKLDRLSRSLSDFLKLMELFERNGVGFVSVTQSLNTSTSQGRLFLHMLLSFGQYEREVTAERIRDKIAASKRRGMWTGGWCPTGFQVKDRKLLVEESEAPLVRRIFQRFLELGSVTLLVRELQTDGATTKRGTPFDKGMIYKMLNNPLYVGDVSHKGTTYPGEHEAIVNRKTFDRVQSVLAQNGRERAATTRRQTPALLKGLIFSEAGRAYTPTHAKKGQKLYRYYVSTDAIRGRKAQGVAESDEAAVPQRLPAELVETATVREMLRLLRGPEVLAEAVRAIQAEVPDVSEREVLEALHGFWDLWGQLIPAEQARIVRLMVERVVVTAGALQVSLRVAGLSAIAREMLAGSKE